MEKYISVRCIEAELIDALLNGEKEENTVHNISSNKLDAIKLSADGLYNIAVHTHMYNSTFFNSNDVEAINSFIHLFSFISDIVINAVSMSTSEEDADNNVKLVSRITSKVFYDLNHKKYLIPRYHYDLDKLESIINDHICIVNRIITYLKDYGVKNADVEAEISDWIFSSFNDAELNYDLDTDKVNIERAVPDNIIYYCKYLVLISILIRFTGIYVYKFDHNTPGEIQNKALNIQAACARMLSNII